MKMELTKKLGIKSFLNTQTGEIFFPDVIVGEEIVRHYYELDPVSYNNNFSNNKSVITRLYRFIDDYNVCRKQGVGINSEEGVKFDISVLLPSIMKNDYFEFPKTIGHYHLQMKGKKVGSPDFYQVVSGRAVLLLQAIHENEVETLVLKVNELETVVIPPQYAHIVINITDSPLVFANICVRAPHLDYENILKFRGGSYYCVHFNGKPIFVKNDNYELNSLSLNQIIFKTEISDYCQLDLVPGKPIYKYIERESKVLDLLCNPEKYLGRFQHF